jgi:hypothetical protein
MKFGREGRGVVEKRNHETPVIHYLTAKKPQRQRFQNRQYS